MQFIFLIIRVDCFIYTAATKTNKRKKIKVKPSPGNKQKQNNISQTNTTFAASQQLLNNCVSQAAVRLHSGGPTQEDGVALRSHLSSVQSVCTHAELVTWPGGLEC